MTNVGCDKPFIVNEPLAALRNFIMYHLLAFIVVFDPTINDADHCCT